MPCNRRIDYTVGLPFDPVFSKYSPGSLLILHIAEAAAREGIERFDLGPGDQLFKQTLKSEFDTCLLWYAQ
ncbi:MAG: GNAT family N-acetyltransferase [Planctomycetaceae bacterium]